jgi:hypothetical protein
MRHGCWQANEAARVTYTDSYLRTGWDQLRAVNNPGLPDATTAYAAGYGEGMITAQSIYNHAFNTGAQSFEPNAKLAAFLAENSQFMAESITNASRQGSSDPLNSYWYHVNLVLLQLQGWALARERVCVCVCHITGMGSPAGLCDGYNASAVAGKYPLSCMAILAINLDGDFEDLLAVLSDPATWYREERFFRASHCSALVKVRAEAFRNLRSKRSPSLPRLAQVLPNNSDIFFSQDTWSSLNSMMRIFKRYDLKFRT